MPVAGIQTRNRLLSMSDSITSITGGASAAVETIKAFQAAVPHAKLLELYGMLETGYHCFTRLTDDQANYLGISADGPFKSDHYRY